MLEERLGKLETDLKVLNAMQDLILQLEQGEFNSNDSSQYPNRLSRSTADHIPVKDTAKPNNNRSQQSISVNKNSRNNVNYEHPPNLKCTRPGERVPNQSLASALDDSSTLSAQLSNYANFNNEDKERRVLKEQAESERSRRVEVEESAKHVYLKLQKVEDELERERKTKETLLSGTLQLKNLVHSYNSKIKELNEDLSSSKAEIQRLEADSQSLSQDYSRATKSLQGLCKDLGGEDSTVESCIEFLSKKIQQLGKSLQNKGNEEVRKLREELDGVLGQLEKFKNEVEITSKELQQCLKREHHLKQQLHVSQVALTTVESDLLKKQVEYECTIHKLQAENQIEQDKASLKLSEYFSVIRRSKSLLLELRNDRDKAKEDLRRALGENLSLNDKLKGLENDKERVIKEVKSLNDKIERLSMEGRAEVERLKEEKARLESNLGKVTFEKRKCVELLNEMKHQILSLKNKFKCERALGEVEKEKLIGENKRLDENLRVLQKISEDQGQTIQKLRSDLEQIKDTKFQLETKIRDFECSEGHLLKKLEQSERKAEQYLSDVEELEGQIEKFKEDLRGHDCEDFVESRFKRKWKECEEEFQHRREEWERNLRGLKDERDCAIETAKKTLEKVDELREHQTSQITQLKSQFRTELAKLLEKNNKQQNEKQNKILTLQSELDRVKLSSSQIQRALSTKIQQLQTALNICIGSNQNSLPVAAFGSNGSVCNNPFANNNPAGNLLLNTTCFGNSTSAGLNEPSTSSTTSTTANFTEEAQAFIQNLM